MFTKLKHPERAAHSKINIAIFASGAGSNAEKIIAASLNSGFYQKENKKKYQVALVVCNKTHAGVLNIAHKAAIPSLIIEKEQFFNGDAYVPQLKNYGINFIVLAGFLWKIPEVLIKEYPQKIINIHPALLPKYGGWGMYGNYVHEAVINNKEKQSGITIHYVNEQYDKGAIILQKKCVVDKADTADSLAQKIHLLEHKYYPPVIEKLVQKL